MLFPKRERSYYQLQAPLTSLIDIVFLLLIYFLLTTNFMVDEGIQVKLPQANATSPQSEKEITIYVDSTGKVFMDNRAVPLNALFTMVKSKLGEKADALVVIKADKSVILNKAVRVMDVAKAAGADRLLLATEKE
ncbi:MAG: biopolymer transporter ExbD [Desulfobacterales bacterium]|nr:biopolymer transporter ExbD [Desulfobacterales bacterium]MDX2510733.1 biopolymer transporter ExbD [Desulfobacterales bacterium]